jgi:hypothetical protein
VTTHQDLDVLRTLADASSGGPVSIDALGSGDPAGALEEQLAHLEAEGLIQYVTSVDAGAVAAPREGPDDRRRVRVTPEGFDALKPRNSL